MTRVSLVCVGLLTVLGLGHGLRGLHRQKLRLEQSLFREKTSDYPEMWHSQILDHFDATNPECVFLDAKAKATCYPVCLLAVSVVKEF